MLLPWKSENLGSVIRLYSQYTYFSFLVLVYVFLQSQIFKCFNSSNFSPRGKIWVFGVEMRLNQAKETHV